MVVQADETRCDAVHQQLKLAFEGGAAAGKIREQAPGESAVKL